jgi:nucleoside phosphorylase/CheY-like chemotaxis protein
MTLQVLLVDDEPSKVRAITEELLRSGLVIYDNIAFARDVVGARKLLKTHSFDVMILDLNLPRRADVENLRDGGAAILRIVESPAYLRPLNIVVMSAYDDSISAARTDLEKLSWRIIKFDYTSREWAPVLQEVLRYVAVLKEQVRFGDGNTYFEDIVMLVALEDTEFKSVLDLPCSWVDTRVPFDPFVWHKGQISSSGAEYSIVLGAAPAMGMPTAAVIATKAISYFRPRLVVMTGICAGRRGKVNYGDVIVADPSWDLSSGKILEKDGEIVLEPAAYQWRLDTAIRQNVLALIRDEAGLHRIRTSFRGAKPETVLKAHIAPIASGGSVLQSAKFMKSIADQHRKVLGVEMEVYSIFSAVHYAPEPKPKCLCVKSVSDFGEDGKIDTFQEYAAYTSAAFVYDFLVRSLESLIPRDPRDG